jgi:hypothetical protein
VMIRQPNAAAYRTAAAVNDTLPLIPADARVIALARVLSKPLENPQTGTGWLLERCGRSEAAATRPCGVAVPGAVRRRRPGRLLLGQSDRRNPTG